jgi:hypothetical protein
MEKEIIFRRLLSFTKMTTFLFLSRESKLDDGRRRQEETEEYRLSCSFCVDGGAELTSRSDKPENVSHLSSCDACLTFASRGHLIAADTSASNFLSSMSAMGPRRPTASSALELSSRSPTQAISEANRCLHDGKHLPKASNSRGDPLIRRRRRSNAHSKLRSFARKPSQVSLSAVTRRSAAP